MLTSVGLLIAGGVLLYFGGESVVRAGTAIGVRIGMPPVVVGLTIVAFGTSAPELAVSIGATLDNHGDVAIANVIGSNLANVALVLGACAVVAPIRVESRLVSIDIPLALLATGALVFCLGDLVLSRVEGGIFVGALTAWLLFSVLTARSESAEIVEEFGGALTGAMTLPKSIGLLVLGLGLLVVGGDLFVDGGVGLASELGVSDALIGFTIIALGTSLPELVTSMVAALRGNADMAVGNIVGSNVYNVLGILGIASLVRPLPEGDLIAADLYITIGVAALLWPLARSSLIIARIEGSLLLTIYVAYVTWRSMIG
ncbi:MAG TPA: calcium/sodium antiporter [Pseudomonadales bacterium]|nr:calcium/sodium antiporter [Pseudomonadales bacterium]